MPYRERKLRKVISRGLSHKEKKETSLQYTAFDRGPVYIEEASGTPPKKLSNKCTAVDQGSSKMPFSHINDHLH